jgi:hypothetical protein
MSAIQHVLLFLLIHLLAMMISLKVMEAIPVLSPRYGTFVNELRATRFKVLIWKPPRLDIPMEPAKELLPKS